MQHHHRVTWVIGNWKQNHRPAAAKVCAEAIADGVGGALSNPHGSAGEVRVGIAPPYLSLEVARPYTRLDDTVFLFAQDCAAQDEGAFTGEVGPAMLRDAEVEGALVGHSERRACFHEDDALIAAKLRGVLASGLVGVLCVGEALPAREAGEHESTVISQLSGALSNLDSKLVSERLVLAYEPVWAIGTGRTATPEQAAQMHATIRSWMRERFGAAGADRSILYGGSVKPGNAAELLAAGDVDGFLVGGASLDPASFLAIVRAAATTPRPG